MMEEEAAKDYVETTQKDIFQSPGVFLREARRKKKLTQTDVAKQLRLRMRWIRDLENDDYTRIPGLIYARGYLRSYARLVDVPPEQILTAFEALGLGDVFASAKNKNVENRIGYEGVLVSHATRIMSRSVLRWVTGSVLLITLFLAGIWWQGQKKHPYKPLEIKNETLEFNKTVIQRATEPSQSGEH